MEGRLLQGKILYISTYSLTQTSSLCEETTIDQLFKKVEALLSEYNRIFICDADNVTSKQFQNIRVGKCRSIFLPKFISKLIKFTKW